MKQRKASRLTDTYTPSLITHWLSLVHDYYRQSDGADGFLIPPSPFFLPLSTIELLFIIFVCVDEEWVYIENYGWFQLNRRYGVFWIASIVIKNGGRITR